MINRHKPIEILNNNNNNDNNNNDDDDDDTDCGEWKMHIKCICTKTFIETRTMHAKSRQVEVYMGSHTENVIDTLFNTLLQNFQHMQEMSN